MREAVRALILETIRRLQPVTEQLLIDELGAHAPARPVLAGYLVKLEVQGSIGRDGDKRHSVREDQVAAEISMREQPAPRPPPPPPEDESPQGDDMPAKTRRCEGCDDELPLARFRKSGRGYAKQCLDCEAEKDDRPAKPQTVVNNLAPLTAQPVVESRVLIRVPSSVGPVEVEISAQAGLEFLRSLLKVA